jgi:hypothetical protein
MMCGLRWIGFRVFIREFYVCYFLPGLKVALAKKAGAKI